MLKMFTNEMLKKILTVSKRKATAAKINTASRSVVSKLLCVFWCVPKSRSCISDCFLAARKSAKPSNCEPVHTSNRKPKDTTYHSSYMTCEILPLSFTFKKNKKNKGTEIPRNLDVVIDVEVGGHKGLSIMPGANHRCRDSRTRWDLPCVASLFSYLLPLWLRCKHAVGKKAKGKAQVFYIYIVIYSY